MRTYNVIYFLDDKENLTCHMDLGTYYDSIIINNETDYIHANPQTIFYVPIHDEQTFVNFKNSVIWAFNHYMKNKHASTHTSPKE